MFDFNRILSHFQRTYYASLLMFLVEGATLLIAIICLKKDKVQKFFLFYIASEFTILAADFLLGAITSLSESVFENFLLVTNSLIALLELCCYYYFFYHFFSSEKLKRIILRMSIFFAIISVLYITGSMSFMAERLRYFSYLFGALEFIFLIPFCLIYFKQLLSKHDSSNLLKLPHFWLTSGIFLFSVFSVPWYLLYDQINTNHPYFLRIFLISFYFLPITINFCFIAKAFLLKRKFIE